ncbi:MAG: T7 capsid protein, partial [Marivivens sp.]|nr:T7 capsid protein [Marivivens sp.]
LAEAYDKKIFRTIALAARQAHPISAAPGPEPGGSQIKLGANNEYNRNAVLNPRQYYALISQVDTNILNRDYGNNAGSVQSGEGLYEIAGIKIWRSNNLPFLAGNVAAVPGENNDYSGDFSTHCGLIYGKEAAGVVEAIGPQIQTTGSDVRTMYQGDIIVGRMAMGADWVNPAAAIELLSAN